MIRKYCVILSLFHSHAHNISTAKRQTESEHKIFMLKPHNSLFFSAMCWYCTNFLGSRSRRLKIVSWMSIDKSEKNEWERQKATTFSCFSSFLWFNNLLVCLMLALLCPHRVAKFIASRSSREAPTTTWWLFEVRWKICSARAISWRYQRWMESD